MVEVRPRASLGHVHHGWLHTIHHFSFADHFDPARLGWGGLRVWNEDKIAPKSGFPPHPHQDMEIITYVREGAITHQDSLGNTGRTEAGDVQVMSAGTGVRHSEQNLETEPTRIFQIWIKPSERGGAPRWGAKPFPKGKRAGRLVALASGYVEDAEALPIRADARVLAATLKAGGSLDYDAKPDRHLYLVPAKGTVEVNGARVETGDGVAITDESVLNIRAINDAEVVLVDAA